MEDTESEPEGEQFQYSVLRVYSKEILVYPKLAQWLSWLERRPVTAEVTGSSPVWVVLVIVLQLRYGILAQLGEHLPYKQRVTGSSPVTSTCISFWCRNAGVAELADAQDLKSCCSDTVPVRFRSPAFIERALDKSVIIDEKKLIEYVCVAQLDRALGYGPRCREFESSRARMLNSLKFLKNQGFKAIFVYADFMNPF